MGRSWVTTDHSKGKIGVCMGGREYIFAPAVWEEIIAELLPIIHGAQHDHAKEFVHFVLNRADAAQTPADLAFDILAHIDAGFSLVPSDEDNANVGNIAGHLHELIDTIRKEKEGVK